ncbi:hypothetical protein IKF26_02585 [Candidatus Saccharibacteria bacterium]|nr:hypothetical protein [Candidatus Saccharibacteria bacterium]
MKKNFGKISLMILAIFLGFGFFNVADIYAEEQTGESVDESAVTSGTSISLMPVSKFLQISSNSIYDNTLTVSNDGGTPIRIEVYAAPYSYIYSDEENAYKLGFNNENNFTQISRWISFKNTEGNYVSKAFFDIDPNSSLEVSYRISTPDNIPSGGQYAVIFAHTLTGVVSTSGIKTEASPGLVVYGRSTEGEAVVSAEISDLIIGQGNLDGSANKNNFYGVAKVKNNGNVDFTAMGTLKVDAILGGSSYETPSTMGRVSIIPGAELAVTDEWTDTPSFGIYKVTWTVKAGEQVETIDKIVFLIPPFVIITSIILLTFLIAWIIVMFRRRKERRSRLAV